MEVRRAIFLRACNHNLVKIAHPVSSKLRSTGNEWLYKTDDGGGSTTTIKFTEESGRNRDICNRNQRNDGKVIILLKCRHLSALLPCHSFR